MAGPAISRVVEFDLTEEAKRYYNWINVLVRVLLLAFAFLLVPFALYQWLVAPSDMVSLEIFLVVLAAAPILAAWGVFKSGRPAVWAGVDFEGVRFRYPHGAECQLRWEDPKLRLSFWDGRRDEAHPVDRADRVYDVLADFSIVRWPSVAITPLAYVTILEQANAHGVMIKPSDWRTPPNRLRVVRLRPGFPRTAPAVA